MEKRIDEEIYFTPKQAADHFNLSLSTIKNYIYASKLKTLRTPGGHHRIRKSELLSTLGDLPAGIENINETSLKDTLCAAMLTVFKAFGPLGNSLTIHARNVSGLSVRIAKAMDMSSLDIKRIEISALLHDIGLTGIERLILLKPSPLTPQEYESVKRHPWIGKEMLVSVKELNGVSDIVAQHHEMVDGTGYPKGLGKEKIHKGARIISVAEAYDSMVSAHSYKKPMSKDMAISELAQQKGAQFDKDVVDVFTRII